MVDIQISEYQSIIIVEVAGRVDSMNASELGNALTEKINDGKVTLVLDLSKVDYMSSAGLREIVTAFKSARKADGHVILAQPSHRVREVLEMSGLDSIFRIFDTRDEALKFFSV